MGDVTERPAVWYVSLQSKGNSDEAYRWRQDAASYRAGQGHDPPRTVSLFARASNHDLPVAEAARDSGVSHRQRLALQHRSHRPLLLAATEPHRTQESPPIIFSLASALSPKARQPNFIFYLSPPT